MDSNISQYLETLIANKTMGEVTSPELSAIANYVFVVFPLGRSTLYYYFSGNLEKNSD